MIKWPDLIDTFGIEFFSRKPLSPMILTAKYVQYNEVTGPKPESSVKDETKC